MSKSNDPYNSPYLDPLDEPFDPELTANIARIKSALNRINDIWDELRERRYIPTNNEIIAMTKEDEHWSTPLLNVVEVEGFYGPEAPEHIKVRLEMGESMERELGEVIYA